MCFNILSPITISNVFNTTPKTITNKGKKKAAVKTLHATVYIAQIDRAIYIHLRLKFNLVH